MPINDDEDNADGKAQSGETASDELEQFDALIDS